MSESYVPSVDDLTRALSYWGRMTRDEARSALAAHDRQVKAEAVREMAEFLFWDEFQDVATITQYHLLLDHADRVEKGDKRDE